MAGQHKCLAVKALTKTLKNGAYAAGNAVRENGGTLAELSMYKYAMTSCPCIFMHDGIARL